jgi:hypothetical protein
VRKVQDPQNDAEWQEAVDLASALLHLDSARQYGLVTGGPEINVERCARLVADGARRGVVPSPDHVERFVAAHNAGGSGGSETKAKPAKKLATKKGN